MMNILVLNAGSTSQKCHLYQAAGGFADLRGDAPTPLWKAEADWSGQAGATALTIATARGATREETLQTDKRGEVITLMLETMWSGETGVIDNDQAIDIVGHRVVHGGDEFEESVVVTQAVKDAIARMAVFAPEQNPANLEGIEAAERLLPGVSQVAVFDTAFHRTMPPAAVVYPIPYQWYSDKHVRRYGFHGISHSYCAHRAAQLLGKDLSSLRLITCHLGGGCSLAAIENGRSVDTTMGFTPLEGLMMGSRSGSIDPGVLLYLIREHGYSASQLNTLLNESSGLKGIAGTGDMRQVVQRMQAGDQLASLAFQMFAHRLRSAIGAMMASLGGLDALVFAGGIGEHSAEVRAAACAPFGFLGIQSDERKNAQISNDGDIAASTSAVRVLVVHTQEEWSIAQECWRIARGQ
ncbi:MAG TPA: acetate kinase [Ktedonobacteraceae bacterium]|nr:acetate kinase [Ktedonobacteraceae bacterium]